jgi:predicted ribosomally synthesized peptide with SipW-like signal peptide
MDGGFGPPGGGFDVGLSDSNVKASVPVVVVLVALAVAGIVPGTAAWLTDSDASTGNTVEAGVSDLKLSEIGPATRDSTTDETRTDAVTDTWEDLSHDETLGEAPVNNTLALNNSASSLAASRVNATVSYAENDSALGSSGNPDRTARTIRVVECIYGGTDLVGSEITDENGNGRIDLEDTTMGETKRNLSSLSGVPAGGGVDLTLSFDGDRGLLTGVAGGDGLDITVEVRTHASFVDRDTSRDNTIRYATL